MSLKVLVGMSGGVDSSVCAKLLSDKGYLVSGMTLSLCEKEGDTSIADAKSVCAKMGIEHISFDLKNEFQNFVIKDFIEEYKSGNTPNPCIVCNRFIKFGAMLEKATELGFQKIATGHYARIEQDKDGRYLLKRAKDLSKDQSYVLYNLTQEQLSKVLFPLGDYTKSEIREIAIECGFVNANRPDSQDICFVPDGDYASFIEKYDDYKSEEGDYVDINGNVIGRHKGVIHYTLGQRKGLGIALGKPQFVIDKNPDTNRVVLGDEEHLFNTCVEVKNVNFIPFDKLEDEMKVTAKLRYRHNAADAVIRPLTNGNIQIVFKEPQRAASPGQSAVFYDGDTVVGGGIIINA